MSSSSASSSMSMSSLLALDPLFIEEKEVLFSVFDKDLQELEYCRFELKINVDVPNNGVELIADEIIDLDKQRVWGGDKFDELYYLKEYGMNTRLLYSKLKT